VYVSNSWFGGMQHKLLPAHKTLRNKHTKIERTSKLHRGSAAIRGKNILGQQRLCHTKFGARIDFVRLLKAQTSNGKVKL